MFWGVIVSMYVGNLVLLALNLPLIPYIARIVYLRRSVLVPLVIAFSLLGVYFTSLNTFDIHLMLGFALAGLALRLAGFPLAPLLLGFILSGMLEDNLRRTLLLADGDFALLLERPASVALALACVAVWLRRQCASCASAGGAFGLNATAMGRWNVKLMECVLAYGLSEANLQDA